MSELKTLGDNVDDFIQMLERVGQMTTQEAVDFIIWRINNRPLEKPNSTEQP
jgi:hypothetical protein